MLNKSKLAIIAFTLFFSTIVSAQIKPIRIGYTNVDYLISLHPDSKKVDAELKSYRAQLDKQGEEFVKDFREKYEAFQKGGQMMSEPVRATKEKELMDMQGRMEEFQKSAESEMQKKQLDLLQPVLDKVQKGINAVAEENGYTYIFNSDAGFGTTPILLYGPENENVSDKVLKKLGITPPAKDINKNGLAPKSKNGVR